MKKLRVRLEKKRYVQMAGRLRKKGGTFGSPAVGMLLVMR